MTAVVAHLSFYRSNRRLYSYEWHRHTNAAEVLQLLQAGTKIVVYDKRKNGTNVTRQALFAILASSEYAGHTLITQSELEKILMRKPGEQPQ